MPPAEGPPLISVVIPAFNAEKTLGETLASAARQTYEKLEIVIVDDGSTDLTGQIAEAFCRDEPRARLLRQSNSGVAAARNTGTREAAGVYVAFLDADDLWHPAKLERQLRVFRTAERRMAFVYTYYHRIDEQGFIIATEPQYFLSGFAFRPHLYLNFAGNGSSILIEKELLLAIGGYDAELRLKGAEGCEDILLQLHVARDHPVGCVPEFLVGYRTTGASMSDNADRMLHSWLAAVEILERGGRLDDRRPARWHAARTAFGLAAARVKRGKPLTALPLLAWSIWADWARALRLLRHFLGKLLSSPGRTTRRPVRFDDADPGDLSSHIRHPRTQWIAAFDRRRVADLRRQEILAREEAAVMAGRDAREISPGGTSVR